MKKYLWILAAAFLLQACSKDEEEGPYVPWRPGDDKEETIDLDKATKVMILTEQAKNRIVMIDQPTGKVAWGWTGPAASVRPRAMLTLWWPSLCRRLCRLRPSPSMTSRDTCAVSTPGSR